MCMSTAFKVGNNPRFKRVRMVIFFVEMQMIRIKCNTISIDRVIYQKKEQKTFATMCYAH